MNGLIPKRSCVNPVLITTFGLEPMGTKRDEGEDPHLFLCPKPGSNRHVFLRTLDFESNASTNSAIRANGLRKNAEESVGFCKYITKS